MLDQLKLYTQGLSDKEYITQWLDRRQKDFGSQSEVEHIIDFFISDKAPKNFIRMTYKEAKAQTDKWDKALQKKGCHIKELKKDTKVILDFKDGFKIVQLIGKNAYEREGFLMRHCVASYYGRSVKIFSLRDKENMPHCTIEQDQQIKGKGNGSIHPKYIGYVIQFLEWAGMQVRDNEMLNLGYINIEKFVNDLHPDSIKELFKGKYWFKDSRILDIDGNEFASLKLLDSIPLITETNTGNIFGLKVNFDLPFFVKASISFLWSKINRENKQDVETGHSAQLAASGNSAQLAGSGSYAKLAASGDSAKLAASGSYAQLAASGNSAQLAASGNSAQLAASGDFAQLAASGYSAKLAASGDYAQLAASGHSAQLAASGHSAKLAASGDSAQLAASGHSAKLAASGNSAQLAASGDSAQLAASGNSAQLAASGNSAKLAASGDSAQLAASGDYAKLAASGDSAKLAASGYSAKLELNGKQSVGAAIGYKNIIKATQGSWIVLAEYDDRGGIKYVKTGQIDGKELKADTWYKLENKEFIEVNN